MCVRVRMCVFVFVCIREKMCVCERERKKEREVITNFLDFRGDKHEGFGDIDVALGAGQCNKACEMHIKQLSSSQMNVTFGAEQYNICV